MTREHKLALIVGFSLVLVLGVLISDHFSKSRRMEIAEDARPATAGQIGAGAARPSPEATIANATQRSDLAPLPGLNRPLPDQNRTQANAIDSRAGNGELTMGRQLPLVGTDLRMLPIENRIDTGATPPVTQPSEPAVATPQIPVQKYDVHEGDNLYRIAAKVYGDGKLWEKVRDYNKGKVGSAGELKDGMTLLLPPKDVLLGKPYVPPAGTGAGASPATTPPTFDPTKPKPETRTADAGDFKDYVVKDGDTLVAIARQQLKSGKRWTEIVAANKGTLSDPDSLSAGMKIRLPVR